MTADELQSVVDSHVNALREHFDAVVIFGSRVVPDGEADGNGGDTETLARGSGNVYARIGMVRAYLLRDEEYERESVRRRNE